MARAIAARLFLAEKRSDVCKQVLFTLLADYPLLLLRSTMGAAFQSTNLTTPFRRLADPAEHANTRLCPRVTRLKPMQESK